MHKVFNTLCYADMLRQYAVAPIRYRSNKMADERTRGS